MRVVTVALIVGLIAGLGGGTASSPAHAVDVPGIIEPIVGAALSWSARLCRHHCTCIRRLTRRSLTPSATSTATAAADVAIHVKHTAAYCSLAALSLNVVPAQNRVDVRWGASGALLWSTASDLIVDVRPLNLGGGRNGVLVLDSSVRIFDGAGQQIHSQPALAEQYHVVAGAASEPDLIVFRHAGVNPHLRAISAATGTMVWDQIVQGGFVYVLPSVNGDARQDLLVRGATADGREFDVALSGASGTTWWARQLTSVCAEQADTGSGVQPRYSTTGQPFGAGDMNGDGFADIGLRASGCPVGATHRPTPPVAVLLDGLDGHERWAQTGTTNMFRGGDSNAEGKPEVVVVAESSTPSHAELVLTKVDGNGTVLATAVDAIDTGGPAGGGSLRDALPAGDANGDGTPDVYVRLKFITAGYPSIARVRSGGALSLIGPDPNPAAAFVPAPVYATKPLFASTDGVGDDFYMNTPTQFVVIDAMTGATRWSYNSPAGLLDTADVNNDGKADLLLRVAQPSPLPHGADSIDVVDGATGTLIWQFLALHPSS